MIKNEKVVKATYELYIAGEQAGTEELYEQATERRPLIYCHGEGMMLPKFEAEMAGKRQVTRSTSSSAKKTPTATTTSAD